MNAPLEKLFKRIAVVFGILTIVSGFVAIWRDNADLGVLFVIAAAMASVALITEWVIGSRNTAPARDSARDGGNLNSNAGVVFTGLDDVIDTRSDAIAAANVAADFAYGVAVFAGTIIGPDLETFDGRLLDHAAASVESEIRKAENARDAAFRAGATSISDDVAVRIGYARELVRRLRREDGIAVEDVDI